ncbi:EAL domain-containing protein [Curvibacter sp. APW13]|uniref:putative bifunctional diguanylate cyclase/phosphodiesterase n=1 Tax=Curvibacter sp. APW13 TaxID=3077236 RepID=UPI0028DF37F5|nr:EAL domain-containing protein [Curvibacter sp. APW13]MDT8990311.1 EAL domain-containing protein [Curvibacter sp. APW13]
MRSAPNEDLDTWRGRLLARLLLVVCLAGWLVGVPSIVLAIYENLWLLVVADSIALAWVSVLCLRRDRDPVANSVQLLMLLYGLGLALLATIGHVSQIYLMALPVLAVLLLSMRAALVCLALNGVTLLAAGYFLPLDAGTTLFSDAPLLRWAAITLNFLLIDTALTAACAFLLQGMEGVLRQQRADAAKLEFFALHDALTGLANRRLLHDRIAQALAQADRDKLLVGVALLDLDHFKNVNDSRGHALGDALIRSVAERLQGAMRSGDTVARLGGDEFVVLLPDVHSETEMLTAVERLLQCVGGTYRVEQETLHVSASIGVAVYPRDGPDADTLLQNADTAMYRAKDGGRNRLQFFQSEMNARLMARMELEAALRGAVERNELVLHFQPRVDARDGRCRSAEALVRWQHPKWGLVSPVRFIPVAEDSGLIVPIGAWILATAAAQLGEWQQRFPALRLSVNLSAREFRHQALAERIEAAAKLVAAGSLELEVTESLVMHNLQTAQELLGRVRALGVTVALDDFGTGFSSLAYLKDLPLDVLKIDQSFVRSLENDPQNRAIVKTIVELAKNLQMATVAEGVETEGQATVLRALAVDELQGYRFARPLPAAEFEAWLAQHYPASA